MKRELSKSSILLLVGVLGASSTLLGCDEECVDGICEPRAGYYYDSLVTGVAYETSNADGPTRTGTTGENDDPGRFMYLNDETVAFSIGNTALGEAAAGPRVTPFELAGLVVPASADEVGGCQVDGTLPEGDFRIVHNLAVLLQTMDTDGDHTTGIEISAEVAALFDVSIDVDQAWEDFQNDTGLAGVLEAANNGNLFPDTRTLREREEALQALYEGIGLCTPES